MTFRRFRARRPTQRPSVDPRDAQAQGPHRAPPAGPPSAELAAAIEASPFAGLGLIPPLVRAVVEEGYQRPSPIQAAVIARALSGRDVIACAQTGTGKTAAFVLPVLQKLAGATSPRARALILAPTRELAAQIADRVAAYGRYLPVRQAVIYGGVSQRPQEVALRAGPDVIVATPGRLFDLIEQRLVDLSGITHFVLDEADRMLDMGFVHDVRRVVAMIPRERQTLFFSATMAPAVEKLARTILVDPERVVISPAQTTAPTVEQSVVFVAGSHKRPLLEELLRDPTVERALVFTRTKHGANRLAEQLERAGIGATAIHGDKTQGARTRALDGFRRGATRVLVATDVAARGIDVDGVSLVVNFDVPNIAESYVHRIGRTGRAGASGRAVSLCDENERAFLADIERLIGRRLPRREVAGGAPPPAPPRDTRRAPHPPAGPHRAPPERGGGPPARRRGHPRPRVPATEY